MVPAHGAEAWLDRAREAGGPRRVERQLLRRSGRPAQTNSIGDDCRRWKNRSRRRRAEVACSHVGHPFMGAAHSFMSASPTQRSRMAKKKAAKKTAAKKTAGK